MLVLALDTATPATTVAVVDSAEVRAEHVVVDPRRHAEVLAPMVVQVLHEAAARLVDVDVVVVGVGPGAYTGLRVGLVTAQSIGDATGLPVHGVVTLDALAWEAGIEGPCAVVTDARRKEVFWARYDDHAQRTSGPEVGRPDVVAAELGPVPVVGAAGTAFADRFVDVREPRLPSAGSLGRLAAIRLSAGDALLPPRPLYLRRPDVTPSASPKPVSRS